MKKTILITGCSSGIGNTAAHALKKRGYRVIASCRKEIDLARLQQEGFETVSLDLDDPNSVSQAAVKVLAMTENRLYALFNNAGFGMYGQLLTLDRQQLEQQFATNFFGVHQLTQLLLPMMLKQREGRVINTSSVMGIISTPGRGAYAASKYALEAWTDALRLEHYQSGVKFSLLEPGPLTTSFKQNVLQTEENKPVKNPKIAEHFGLSTEHVLPYIYHALEHKHPKVRYRITLLTKGSNLLKRLLPDKWLDRILKSK